MIPTYIIAAETDEPINDLIEIAYYSGLTQPVLGSPVRGWSMIGDLSTLNTDHMVIFGFTYISAYDKEGLMRLGSMQEQFTARSGRTYMIWAVSYMDSLIYHIEGDDGYDDYEAHQQELQDQWAEQHRINNADPTIGLTPTECIELSHGLYKPDKE